jgi:hypothetical protein
VDGEDGEHTTIPFVVGSEPMTVKVTMGEPSASQDADQGRKGDTSATGLGAELIRTVAYGKVTGSRGDPIAKARITVHTLTGETRTTTSQADGSFALAGLNAGPADLDVVADHHVTKHQDLTITDGPFQPLDVSLASSWRLQVAVVTPSGEPIETWLRQRVKPRFSTEDFHVVATREPPGAMLAVRGNPAILAESRRSESDEGTALDLDATPPLHVSAVLGERVLATQPVKGPLDSITLVGPAEIETARVKMRIVDGATGEPLDPDAVVMMTNSFQLTRGTKLVERESDGTLVVPNVLFGRRSLMITLAGYAGFQGEVDVEQPALDLGVIALSRPRTIQVRLLDGGRAVSAALRVRDLDLEARSPPLRSRSSTQQSGDGYRVSCGAGRQLVVIKDPSYALQGVIADTTQSDAKIEIPLERGTPVTIRHREENGVALDLLDDQGIVLATETLHAGESAHLRLLPGTHRVVVRAPGKDARSESIVVATTPSVITLGETR